MRPLVTMNQLSTLATTWYSTRLQENSRRPQPDEMRSIFASLGLGGDFWDPQSDIFGRSEERRVGKECRPLCSPYHYKKTDTLYYSATGTHPSMHMHSGSEPGMTYE